MNIPQEIVEAIADELEYSSLYAFSLASIHFVHPSQARIFRSLQIRVEGSSNDGGRTLSTDYRHMSPWQADRVFSSSPHLASYVRRLWVDIPPPKHYPRMMRDLVRPMYCYPPLQIVLPTFSGIRELVISGPSSQRWAVLPQALKDAIQAIMLLSSLNELHFSGLSIPPALIGFVVASVSALTLSYVVVENAELQSLPTAAQVLRILTLRNISDSMVTFLAKPGALSVQHLSFMYPVMGDHINKILQGSADTLTQLRFGVEHMRLLGDVQVPYLHELRVLELDSELSVTLGPYYCLPRLFVSILTQIPRAMPHLDRVLLRATISELRASMWSGGEDARWEDSGPLDLGHLGVVHAQLRFIDYLPFDFSEATRELREKMYGRFVRSMGEQLPALRDNGGLSFSQLVIPLYTQSKL
ncbi:hypothetical protein DFH08DRAFT_895383 [Mycena albidolilacea]|uniref:F-box domain-containing protein n=1 Tax=Mycena albidolilacea TaxID=1033008 RepID=A0AAD7ED87_9AGAR|nr:hypothetical protein DFH08DRAFT_895383 [Mycena albidolilacea]